MSWEEDIVVATGDINKAITEGQKEAAALAAQLAQQKELNAQLTRQLADAAEEIKRLRKELDEQNNPAPELPTQGSAIPTFHCLSLYWDPPSALEKDALIDVRYCENVPGAAWRQGWWLFYDPRPFTDVVNGRPIPKARGSLVGLRPGVEYIVQFGIGGQWKAQLCQRTWDEKFRECRVCAIPDSNKQITISNGGSRTDGYVVYNGGSVDVKKDADWCLKVDASYVIIRGATLKGAKHGCILIGLGVHDVVIEDCDLSDWGSFRVEGTLGKYGVNYQGAITNLGAAWDAAYRARAIENCRIVIQRNKIHEPTYGTNPWEEPVKDNHPYGPHAVYLENSGGNNVIRYNDIYADNDDPRVSNHWFNDPFGALDNASKNPGFPGADSDIYGNNIRHSMDDGTEAEGLGCNVRIWGNRYDFSSASIVGTNVVTIGPTYIWRNLSVRVRPGAARGPFFIKCGDRDGLGGGKKFVFHNLALQPNLSRAVDDVSKPGSGIYARNNIWSMADKTAGTYGLTGGTNSLDYNMTNAAAWGQLAGGGERHGWLNATPKFKVGVGGDYVLASDSPGKGKAEPLPMFNIGPGADVGIAQEGDPIMKFGVEVGNAHQLEERP